MLHCTTCVKAEKLSSLVDYIKSAFYDKLQLNTHLFLSKLNSKEESALKEPSAAIMSNRGDVCTDS